MKKQELSDLLHSLQIPVNEGIASQENTNKYPRVVYWDYIWEDILASGISIHAPARGEYENVETYQISFYSRTPRNEKLMELREKLRKVGLHPTIYHEYVQEDKVFHSYFSVEVTV